MIDREREKQLSQLLLPVTVAYIRERLRRLRVANSMTENIGGRTVDDPQAYAEQGDFSRTQGFLYEQLLNIGQNQKVQLPQKPEVVEWGVGVKIKEKRMKPKFYLFGSGLDSSYGPELPVGEIISVECCLGKEIVGKRRGDSFRYETPDGQTVEGKVEAVLPYASFMNLQKRKS